MEIFDDTFVPVGLSDVEPRRCPRCVWPYLRPVQSRDVTRLLCQSCGHCWNLERGRLRPVDVLACHGCAEHAQSQCIALLQDEFPRFGPSELDVVGTAQ
jgi:hypothetical protein